MLIVLGLYFLIIWLVFFKFKALPWNKTWKTISYSAALFIALVVIGALNYYTPSSASAVVQSQNQRIYPQMRGQVQNVNHDSEFVSKGDVLFTLDPTSFKLTVDSSKANLDLAKIKYADVKVLVDKGVEREKSLDLADVELRIAIAQYEKALFDLDNTEIKAPFDGQIIAASLTKGQTVSPATSVMTIQQSKKQWLTVVVEQSGMANMKINDEAKIVFSSAPGDIYYSKVISISQGLIQGQFFAEDRNRPLDNLLGARPLYAVKVAIPVDAPDFVKREGTTAGVTVFTDQENPINILANILQWISSVMAYL